MSPNKKYNNQENEDSLLISQQSINKKYPAMKTSNFYLNKSQKDDSK